MSLCDQESWPGPQTDVEAWHFFHGDSEFGHKLCVRHSLTLNKYTVLLDGRIIKEGRVPLLQRTFSIFFTLDDTQASAVIECASATMSVKRKLLIGDEFFPSLNSILRSADQVAPNVGTNAPSRVGITDFRQFLEKGEDKLVTVYQIYVEPTLGSARMAEDRPQEKTVSSSKLVIVERRFSEFVILDTTLRLLVGDSAVTELGVPPLPPKVYNPLVDQASEAFLQGRRAALEVYLTSVLELVDHFGHPQELYTFLGLNPVTGLKQEAGEDAEGPLGGGLSGPGYSLFRADRRKGVMRSMNV